MQQLSLDGAWQLRWFDGQRGKSRLAAEGLETDPSNYIEALVPGEVHLDMMRHGLIADTDRGANVLAARWVEEMIYTYRREFDAPAEALAGAARAWLVFDRLDLVANVVLNGVAVGGHGNTFHPCRLDVTGKLKPGRNVLVVHVESGLYAAADKQADGYAHHEDGLLHKRHWHRKPQCQFGWDWAPRLINVGITGPVRLEWTAGTVRVDTFVPLVTLDADLKRGHVTGRLFVEGLGAEKTGAKLTVEVPELGLSTTADVELAPGMNRVEAAIDVPSPEPWWPLGHGPQRRYAVRATLQTARGETSAREALVGFRHVRWDQSPHPEKGSYFRLFVNGRPIFCKGGNFVPADTITARLDEARYRGLVDAALEANFNFLRVWGGGLYESDAFYDLCDDKGLLVWQEFIYACSRYPTVDEPFHNDAKVEAAYQIRRLASHPSLVAWCGNNEMEEANWHWGYDKKVALPDHGFFHVTLPRLMNEEDPTRYYQPSSPLSPMGVDPRADHVGDQHPWTLGFFDVDTRKYRDMICRFPNEGGVMGPTSLPTMLECFGDAPPTLGSFPWRVHDNSIATWREPSVIDGMTGAVLGKEQAGMSLEEYVYWGGLAQGEGLKEYIESFRRRMFSSAAAIFWMFNDTWPAVRSWTIIDYRLRRTPSFHPVRRAMAPVHVVLATEGGTVTVYGVNDTTDAVDADLRHGLFELAGRYPIDERSRVRLEPNSSTPLASFAQDRWTDPTTAGAFAVLTRPGTGETLARNRLFLPMLKDLRWPAPRVEVRRDGDALRFRSNTFVLGVCLDLDGGPVADNFFDLLPGVEHLVAWRAPEMPRVRVGDPSRPGTALVVQEPARL